MGNCESLSLTSIDSMRHLVVSEEIVAAVAFAARAGHGTRTCYRFVTAVSMKGALKNSSEWGGILKQVMDLETGGVG